MNVLNKWCNTQCYLCFALWFLFLGVLAFGVVLLFLPFISTSRSFMVTYMSLCRCATRLVSMLQVLLHCSALVISVRLFLCAFTRTGMKKNMPVNSDENVRTNM